MCVVKPQNIFLVRHGQSHGNADKDTYNKVLDHKIQLTDLGHSQANEVGKTLSALINEKGSTQFYCSAYWRTRQTFLGIQQHFTNFDYLEDPRLREQEVGNNKGKNELVMRDYDRHGHFYYKYKNGGESCANVYDRMSSFINWMNDDFKRADFPNNLIIVSHGMAIRIFLMAFFKCSVEEFYSWRNPRNCGYYHIVQENGIYKLNTPMKLYKRRDEFDWGTYSKFGQLKLQIT
jgi:broad specificity phosphatase PhoE